MAQSGGQNATTDQNFDYMFKLLIIGNSSVGKTSFLFRYCDDSFTSAFVSTVGIDFKVKTVFRGDKRVKLQIWVRCGCDLLVGSWHLQDTAGQERYRTITTAYYRGAMGFILMYDITNEESFNSTGARRSRPTRGRTRKSCSSATSATWTTNVWCPSSEGVSLRIN